MENENLDEDVSDQKVEVGQQEEVLPECAVAAVERLNLEVPEVPDNTKSPSYALSGDGEMFITIYDRSEWQLSKNWMEHTWFMRGGVAYFTVQLLITPKFKSFL